MRFAARAGGRRASLRAELVRIGTRWLIKHRGRHATLEQMRERMRALEAVTPTPPAGTMTEMIDAGAVKAHRIATSASRSDRHVLFLHGGGYASGSPSAYRHFTWRIATATRATVVAIDYRLAPEHPFPAALEDAVSAYRWLLANRADLGRLIVIGDSAGGGLAFALSLKLGDEGLPAPAAIVALSPWTDLALSGASLKLNAKADPLMNSGTVTAYARAYLAGADPYTPYASPLYGDLRKAPPALIQVGSDEVLRDDAVRMAEQLHAAGRQVELEIWPRMPHVWHLFAPILPEADRAIKRIGTFVESTLDRM
jgi:acetyl esterase/lipase